MCCSQTPCYDLYSPSGSRASPVFAAPVEVDYPLFVAMLTVLLVTLLEIFILVGVVAFRFFCEIRFADFCTLR